MVKALVGLLSVLLLLNTIHLPFNVAEPVGNVDVSLDVYEIAAEPKYDVDSAVEWIVQHTPYSLGDLSFLPSVEIKSKEHMEYFFRSVTDDHSADTSRIQGLYYKPTYTIYISEDAEDIQATYIHELIHHFQWLTGYEPHNNACRELEAHTYTDQWIMQNTLGSPTSPYRLKILQAECEMGPIP